MAIIVFIKVLIERLRQNKIHKHNSNIFIGQKDRQDIIQYLARIREMADTKGDYFHLIFEELCEAGEAVTERERRKELVQVMALCLRYLEGGK